MVGFSGNFYEENEEDTTVGFGRTVMTDDNNCIASECIEHGLSVAVLFELSYHLIVLRPVPLAYLAP